MRFNTENSKFGVQKYLDSVEVYGTTSSESISVRRASRQSREAVNQHLRIARQDARREKEIDRRDGKTVRECSINPRFASEKPVRLSPRALPASSAVRVIPGVHVPESLRNSPNYLGEISIEATPRVDWVQWLMDRPEALDDRSTAKAFAADHGAANVAPIKERAAQVSAGTLDPQEFGDFVRRIIAAQGTVDLPPVPEKHRENRPARSVIEQLQHPGEHLPARPTPAALKAITVDRNGKLHSAPSARTVEIGGEKIRAVELSAEEQAEEDALRNLRNAETHLQKTTNKLGERRVQAEAKIEFLDREVERLRRIQTEQGLGEAQRQDLSRLSRDRKATATRLENVLAPIREVATQTKKLSGEDCHCGTIHAPGGCQRKKVLLALDKARGIVKRG